MRRKFFLIIFILVSLFINLILVINPSLATTFTENFSTTAYKDIANTTADWDTTEGKLKLPQLGWTKADGSSSGYDNVSNTTDNSEAPKIVLDSNGRPNVVWTDYTPGNYEVFFSKWNGSAWTKADGVTPGYDNVSNNNGSSISTKLILDSNWRPNIVWSDNTTGNSEILFTRWNSSAWTKADGTPGYDNVSNTAGGSYTSRIVLDSSQRPNILWDDSTPGNRDTFFSKWTSPNWTKADGTPGYDNVSNTGGDSFSKEILLDSSGRPNVVWYDKTPDPPGIPDIFFCKWNGTQWTKADGVNLGYDNISNNGGTSWHPQMFLDSSGKPNIVWYDNALGNYEIFFCKWTSPNWTGADGSTLGYDNISNNGGDSREPQLAFDSASRPNIVWEDDTLGNRDIFFSRWNGTIWTGLATSNYDNVSNNSGWSASSQIILDANSRPNIVWDDSTTGNGDIFFSKWNGTAWTKADGSSAGYDNVSNNSGWSRNPKIVLDSSQRPNLVWYDETPGKSEVYFSKWSGYGTPRQAQSLKINTGSNIVIKATLAATANLNGQTINYYLSANGGTDWENVTPGVEHIFTNKGNDLRWKAIISTTDRFVTPTIDSLSINYSYDTTPPTGSILINQGETFTHSAQVTLVLQASDNVEVLWMIVSNDSAFAGATWDAYQSSLNWNLSSGDGEKTVYVKYKDGAGNESVIYADSITLLSQKSMQRLYGPTRYETAVEIAKYGWGSSNSVILARGDLFPDALSGASLAKKEGAPILLTQPSSLTPATKEEISRLKAKKVFILGSDNAIYPQVEEDIKNQLGITNIERYGGATRYETASIIAEKLTPLTTDTAIIATGENYPDALASASLSYYKKMPILLVRGDIGTIPSATSEALEKLNIKSLYIVGGTDVVPQGIEDIFKNNGYATLRMAGPTRYETCRMIADKGLSLGMLRDVISVAVGENFPDALTLGPLAGKNSGPLLLVRTTFIPGSISDFITNNKNEIYKGLIAGGTDVVSQDVENQILNIIK